MFVQVIEFFGRALFDLTHYLSNLLRHEINTDCKESLLAVFDAMLLQTHLDRVLWSYVVDDFVSKALSPEFTIALIEKSARHCDV